MGVLVTALLHLCKANSARLHVPRVLVLALLGLWIASSAAATPGLHVVVC